MSQPYLFYSERCPNSKQIIETLKALNKTSLYKFILVESLARDQIPGFLKKVPTLYVPETKEVVVGKDIYGFIAKPTNARKELPTKETPQAQAQQIGELSAWGFEGQGKLSESYSLWDAPTQFASSGGSQRRRPHRPRNADLGDDYDSELLPPLSKAGRHDRHCRNRCC
jgi:hypothetical protein